jgi:glycosyltransferase involved in cell wall biosynthesis
VEAMSNGCVPVAFDSYGAVHDIIVDGVNGLIVPAFDIDGYAAALRKLMNNADLFAKMQSAALCTPDKFAVEKVAAKWEALFTELERGHNCL